MQFLGWFLLAWVVASAVATPLVGRLIANRLGDPPPEKDRTPELSRAAHD